MGEYGQIRGKTCGGLPVWKLISPEHERYIYSDPDSGRWGISDQVANGTHFIESSAASSSPTNCALWKYLGDDDGWKEDNCLIIKKGNKLKNIVERLKTLCC